MTESSSSSNTTAVVAAVSTVLATAAVGTLWRMKAKAQEKVNQPIFPGIPYAPGGHWLLGHLILLNGDGNFVQGYKKVYENSADPESGLCSMWFATQPAVSVLLGHHVKAVLSASSFRTGIRLMKYHNDNFLGAKALTQLMGKEWKLYRSAVHKSFTPGALKQSQDSINRVGMTLTKSLLAAIENSPMQSLQQPLLPLMKMATMDVFGLAALDADFHCCQQLELTAVASAFEHLTTEYTRRMGTPWDVSSWLYGLPTAANRQHYQQRQIIRSYIAEQIAKTRAELAADSSQEHSKHNLLTNILKTAEQQKDEPISDDAIGDILMTLLFGGYDTTSITLSYALYLLATHPDIEAECLKEVQAVLPTDQATENLQGPEQLQYTRAVILETLRLYPPAPTTTRNLEKPMELQGHVFDKGTSVFVPIWSIQRDARNFPKPSDLRPERWVRSTESGWEERPSDDLTSCTDVPPANRDAFCVFAAGARNCVGRQLALQESVTLLALLIRQLKFQLVAPDYQVKPKLCSVVQQPDDGVPMIITAR